MEDSIEMVLQEYGKVLPTTRPHPVLTACTGVMLTGMYGVWSLFAMPGFRKIPLNLKHSAPCYVGKKKEASTVRTRWTRKHDDQEQIVSSLVPYLPSSKNQTLNTMKLLEGRTGHLADLGSGDGRLMATYTVQLLDFTAIVFTSADLISQVFAASSAGFQSTGFEINSILLAYARNKAQWTGVPSSQATFVKKDFWKTDLSKYNNVTAFLAPGVMEALGEKLVKELPDDARVIACRFPFPNWPHHSTAGSGLDQTWAYDMSTVRSSLRNVSSTKEVIRTDASEKIEDCKDERDSD